MGYIKRGDIVKPRSWDDMKKYHTRRSFGRSIEIPAFGKTYVYSEEAYKGMCDYTYVVAAEPGLSLIPLVLESMWPHGSFSAYPLCMFELCDNSSDSDDIADFLGGFTEVAHE